MSFKNWTIENTLYKPLNFPFWGQIYFGSTCVGQPQNTVFEHSHRHQLCVFTSDEQEPACCACLKKKKKKSLWLSRIWFVFHIAVTTAETNHPPPHCAHVHCLFFINVEQALMDVSGCNFFHLEEYNDLSSLCALQNHILVGLARDLKRSLHPDPLIKQVPYGRSHRWVSRQLLAYLCRRRLHHLSGQPVPVLHHPYCKEVLPRVCMELLTFKF